MRGAQAISLPWSRLHKVPFPSIGWYAARLRESLSR